MSDVAKAHEVADQAARLIGEFGERLAALVAEFQAQHCGDAWSERDDRTALEAWQGPWEASGLDALWDRLDDLHGAVDAALSQRAP